MPGISLITTTPGPLPARYTVRVFPSCVNVVSVNASSTAAMSAETTSPGSEPRELFAEEAEAHADGVEGIGMEGREVEAGTFAAPGVLSALEPHALADLVADRLRGPSEVAIDLAAHELLGKTAALDHERQRELRRPPLAGVVTLVCGDRQLQMHADVHDDAHGAHGLRGQHSHLPCRILEVAELSHQSFGVQCPALAVARHEAHQPLETRQLAGEILHLTHLQVMSGDRLVVAGAHLLPERKACRTERRVPRAAGTREVLARAGVVHRGRAAGRRDHRLAALQRLGDVEVHAGEHGNGPVDEVLVPSAELVDTLDRPRRVGVEVLDHPGDRLARKDALADDLHLMLDAVQFLDAPRVRLVEVQIDTIERGGEQLVPIPADRVARIRL